MKFLLTAWLAIATSLAAAPLKFDKTLIEVHAPIDSETVTEDFKFTNTGDTAVVIREADAGCSCLSVLVSGGKLAYAPGESGTLRANFSLGSFQGEVDKQINIWLEGDPDEKPSNTVTMRVHIPQIIKITPRTIKWKMGSDPVMQIVEIEKDLIDAKELDYDLLKYAKKNGFSALPGSSSHWRIFTPQATNVSTLI